MLEFLADSRLGAGGGAGGAPAEEPNDGENPMPDIPVFEDNIELIKKSQIEKHKKVNLEEEAVAVLSKRVRPQMTVMGVAVVQLI